LLENSKNIGGIKMLVDYDFTSFSEARASAPTTSYTKTNYFEGLEMKGDEVLLKWEGGYLVSEYSLQEKVKSAMVNGCFWWYGVVEVGERKRAVAYVAIRNTPVPTKEVDWRDNFKDEEILY